MALDSDPNSTNSVAPVPLTDLVGYSRELLAQLVLSHPLGYEPKLIWKKLRVSAGLAYFTKGQIALSAIVLRDRAAVSDTLIHEYAHLLAVSRHGRAGVGHGAAWKQAMADLGAQPEVRHRYAVLRNAKRQVVTYKCVRCGALIERNRRLPRRRKYLHVACGGEIKLQAVRAQS